MAPVLGERARSEEVRPSSNTIVDDRVPSGVSVWGAEIRFSRCDAVFVDESAEAVSTLDLVCARPGYESEGWQLGVWRRQVERAMRPVAVVVTDEDSEHSLEVPPVEDEEANRDIPIGWCGRSARRSRSPSALGPAYG